MQSPLAAAGCGSQLRQANLGQSRSLETQTSWVQPRQQRMPVAHEEVQAEVLVGGSAASMAAGDPESAIGGDGSDAPAIDASTRLERGVCERWL